MIPSVARDFVARHEVPVITVSYPNPLPDVETVSVGALVDKNTILYMNHRDRAWELPGGKSQLRERPAETVVREVREETGYQMSTAEPLGAVVFFGPKDETLTKTVWGCRSYTRVSTPEEIVTALRWSTRPPSPLSFGTYETATLLFVRAFLDEKPESNHDSCSCYETED